MDLIYNDDVGAFLSYSFYEDYNLGMKIVSLNLHVHLR